MLLSSIGLLDTPLYSPMTLALGSFFPSIPNLTIHSGWSQQPVDNLCNTLILKFLDICFSYPHLPSHLGTFWNPKFVPPVRPQLQMFLPGYNFLTLQLTQFPLLPHPSTLSHFYFPFQPSYITCPITVVIFLSIFFMILLPVYQTCLCRVVPRVRWVNLLPTSSSPHFPKM